MGEVAAILEASPSGAIQPDPSHTGSNRNEKLGVLFYSCFSVSESLVLKTEDSVMLSSVLSGTD